MNNNNDIERQNAFIVREEGLWGLDSGSGEEMFCVSCKLPVEYFNDKTAAKIFASILSVAYDIASLAVNENIEAAEDIWKRLRSRKRVGSLQNAIWLVLKEHQGNPMNCEEIFYALWRGYTFPSGIQSSPFFEEPLNVFTHRIKRSIQSAISKLNSKKKESGAYIEGIDMRDGKGVCYELLM